MKKYAFIFFIFMSAGLKLSGQENPITEFDLYGRWIMEIEKVGQIPEEPIYILNLEPEIDLGENWTEISLLAFNKCEFNSSRKRNQWICGSQPTYQDVNSWTFDRACNIVTVSTVNTLMKEFSEENPEEYAEFGSPLWTKKNEYKVIRLAENKLGLKKLRTTQPIRNAD